MTDKAVIIARLRGAIVAIEHNDNKAAEELVTGVRAALLCGIGEEARQARALAMGEAVDADSVECDGRRLR